MQSIRCTTEKEAEFAKCTLKRSKYTETYHRNNHSYPIE